MKHPGCFCFTLQPEVIQEETKLAWSSGVTFYRLKDLSNKTSFVSSVFFDPFRRSGKRRGFWSSKIQGYSELLGDRNGPRRPAVNVVADLERPQEGQSQPLLTHREARRRNQVASRLEAIALSFPKRSRNQIISASVSYTASNY